MRVRTTPPEVERARVEYQKVLKLYRARPSDALFELVRSAHQTLQDAQRDAVVEGWSPPGTVCPRCQTHLSRREETVSTRYGCIACGFELSVCR